MTKPPNEFVLITGADSGFGKLLVDRILQARSDIGVIACYYPQTVLESEPNASRRLSKQIVDITSDQSVDTLSRNVKRFLESIPDGKLVGLVNNAGGLLASGPVEWTPVDIDKAQMELNFIGTVRITKAFLPLVRESGKGRVVNVSSILGLIASPLGGVYAASKFAVEGWTDALRCEMLPFGVHVSLIAPGMFRGTDFYKNYTTPVESGWGKLDPSIKQAYGEHYKGYVVERLLKVFAALGTADPMPVVEAMEHALFAQRPKRRYRLGNDCIVLARILSWVPTCVSDLALTVADVLVTRDLKMYPRMPKKGISSSWISIVWFSFFGYSMSSMWLIAVTVAVVFVVFQLV